MSAIFLKNCNCVANSMVYHINVLLQFRHIHEKLLWAGLVALKEMCFKKNAKGFV